MRDCSSNSTVASLVFWIGIVMFAYLKWHLPEGRPPHDLLEFLSVGACVAGGILLFGEVGANLMRSRDSGVVDRGFGAMMLLSALLLGIALVAYSIATYQSELLLALIFGAALYLTFLRNPFVSLTRF
ncbi:sugar phosphate permease [Duganella sp. 1224]|uniref:hypothetical protein n=1 Tax=Duganella sp. 1224 TaxID=2587052 RepID=UPI0015CD955A|nr:hypothetical protein [Duganella sp. 1224]NYE61995.1 sugar phosphate permease [Duganella sp. 1224]